MSEKKEKKGLGDFFKGYKSELKKIVWPSWKTILKNTGIVITFIVILGLFIYAVDFLFSLLFNWVVGLM